MCPKSSRNLITHVVSGPVRGVERGLEELSEPHLSGLDARSLPVLKNLEFGYLNRHWSKRVTMTHTPFQHLVAVYRCQARECWTLGSACCKLSCGHLISASLHPHPFPWSNFTCYSPCLYLYFPHLHLSSPPSPDPTFARTPICRDEWCLSCGGGYSIGRERGDHWGHWGQWRYVVTCTDLCNPNQEQR